MDWLIYTLSWYFYMVVLGLVFLPIANFIFPKTLDKGYAFAKTIGLIVLSYVFMTLGVMRLLPYGRMQIFFVLLAFAFVLHRKKIISREGFSFPKFLKDNLKTIKWALFIEILFFVSLVTWTIVRGQEPNIRGLEKFMDYGFMQSISRTTYMPPLDMWYSADIETRPKGYFINYYYFGHLSGSLLTKLTDVPPEAGYNLILANLFALGMTMSFSIVVNILHFFQSFVFEAKKVLTDKKIAILGMLGAFLVNCAGNWHLIYIFTKGYPNESPVPPWTVLPDLRAQFAVISSRFPDLLGALGEYSKYWYPNATRFIPNTIHEFPSYSYVVADLHGHVFDIPFVLFSIGVVLFVLVPLIIERWGYQTVTAHEKGHNQKGVVEADRVGDLKRAIENVTGGNSLVTQFLLFCVDSRVHVTILLAFMTAVHYMTNAFNGPIYLLFFLVALFALHTISLRFLLNVGVLIVGFLVFSLPFSLFFEPFVSGVGVNCGFPLVQSMVKSGETSVKIGPFLFEKGNCQISEPYQLIILWGMFWFFGILLASLIFISRRYAKSAVVDDHERAQLKRMRMSDYVVLGVFGFGTMLLIIPEFFYIKDIYPTHFRANTMFKLGYQAYMMMTIAVPYVLWRISLLPNTMKKLRLGLMISAYAAVIMVSPYMFYSVQAYYGNMSRPVNLDGISWLKTEMPDVYDIVNFLNTKVSGQPVILEAQGDSYTDYNVISAYTGLPTVSGWWVHEWLWRGNADIVGKRIPFIEAMYRSNDLEETRKNLRRFNVKYVIVSSNERKKYETDNQKVNEKKFTKLGREIYRSTDGKGVVYEMY